MIFIVLRNLAQSCLTRCAGMNWSGMGVGVGADASGAGSAGILKHW